MNPRLVFTILLVALSVDAMHSTIRSVPSSYPTIQQAITASVNGDTVLVAPGTYFENIVFRGKRIVVTSWFALNSNPAYISSTTINGSTPANPDTASCVRIVNGEDSTTILQGFTLTGGTGSKALDTHSGLVYREGGAILTEASSPVIRFNRIIGNVATNMQGVVSAGGGGLRCDGGAAKILNNIIMNNAGRYGAGIVVYYAGITIKNNVIANNTGGEDYGGSGVWVTSNGPSGKLIENNTIVRNSSTLDGGGVLVWSTTVTLRNNIVWGNTAPTGPNIRLRSGGVANVTYSDVQGGFTGVGNIDLDPMFSDSSFYLQQGSPCVDAGDTSAVLNDPPDFINPSLARWPARGGRRNDMGAYGGPGTALIATFPTDVDDQPSIEIPNRFLLHQNYPNPFNPTTQIRFEVAHSGVAALKIFDVLGREVASLLKEEVDASSYVVPFDAGGLPSGVYFYRLTVGNISATRQMLLLR